MAFTFPPSLRPLQAYLKSNGLTGGSIKTSRQAAFLAQQLLNSRIAFPSRGEDMTETLLAIQEQGIASGHLVKKPAAKSKAKQKNGRGVYEAKITPNPYYLAGFHPDLALTGTHIYVDGACVPNPGPGGWAMVVYSGEDEIHQESGGELDTTNNVMELTGLLHAIRWSLVHSSHDVVIWSDSQYCVKGLYVWRQKWKANGWKRGGARSTPENQQLANLDLWQAIDEAMSEPNAGFISVRWIKGHAGHKGNERADEIAETARKSLVNQHRSARGTGSKAAALPQRERHDGRLSSSDGAGHDAQPSDLLSLDREYAAIMNEGN